MESSRKIEEIAAAWLLKRDGGTWSHEDQGQLIAWLDSATENRVAFLRLEAAWDEMNRLQALGAGLPARTVPTPDELRQLPGWADSERSGRGVASERGAFFSTRRVRNGMRLLAVAASLVVLALGILYMAGPFFAGDSYSTPVGAVTSVPLRDGSSITLNTASEVRVQLTEKERLIDLARGEAFFEVAKDPARPFIVQAADKRVIAVGTKFSVRRDEDDVRVVVTEGVVRLESNAGSTRVLPAEGEMLSAGSVARATAGDTLVQRASLPRAEELLSWRSGYLVFDETALADAIAEFNRYNERKIVIRDPRIAAMRLTGKFRSNNFEAFVRLLEESFPIRSQHLPDQIVLTEDSHPRAARTGATP